MQTVITVKKFRHIHDFFHGKSSRSWEKRKQCIFILPCLWSKIHNRKKSLPKAEKQNFNRFNRKTDRKSAIFVVYKKLCDSNRSTSACEIETKIWKRVQTKLTIVISNYNLFYLPSFLKWTDRTLRGL